MAKLAFSKLKCKLNAEVKTITFADEEIEVKQYLSLREKIALINNVVNEAYEEGSNYFNPIKLKILTDLEVLFNYTNIIFTDKQKEDYCKLYDIVYSSHLLEKVIKAMGENEYLTICESVQKSVIALYEYKNSVLGIVDALKEDQVIYGDIAEIRKELMQLEDSPILQALAKMD